MSSYYIPFISKRTHPLFSIKGLFINPFVLSFFTLINDDENYTSIMGVKFMVKRKGNPKYKKVKVKGRMVYKLKKKPVKKKVIRKKKPVKRKAAKKKKR